MDATASSSRRERGLQIVKDKAKSIRPIAGDSYFVPSQTNAGSGYVVDLSGEGRCTCPDQLNEVLLKCLCFNLSMLVHSIHELGVEPKFWLPKQVQT